MPQRNLTTAEWNLVVRTIEDAQHLLRALPRKPELQQSIDEQVQALERANLVLGFDPATEELPLGSRSS